MKSLDHAKVPSGRSGWLSAAAVKDRCGVEALRSTIVSRTIIKVLADLPPWSGRRGIGVQQLITFFITPLVKY
jgi:hypothetical protein